MSFPAPVMEHTLWSAMPGSNRRCYLGRVMCYHYTNSACLAYFPRLTKSRCGMPARRLLIVSPCCSPGCHSYYRGVCVRLSRKGATLLSPLLPFRKRRGFVFYRLVKRNTRRPFPAPGPADGSDIYLARKCALQKAHSTFAPVRCQLWVLVERLGLAPSGSYVHPL